ncbi:MAG TPA: hypothetical protein VFX59_04760 [Polyangiales bacterium]|nr:hypothetical protein [Polyangiales bacterium]
MGTLRELASDPTKREGLLQDALKAVDAEVSDKGGISGMAIKAAYMMAKGVAPGILYKAINAMADEFLDALQPFYDQSKAKGVALRAYLDPTDKKLEASNALLAITDARANQEQGGALKKGYEKLRPTAQKHVEQAIPRLADMISKFAG